jgi:hypothetical protein
MMRRDADWERVAGWLSGASLPLESVAKSYDILGVLPETGAGPEDRVVCFYENCAERINLVEGIGAFVCSTFCIFLRCCYVRHVIWRVVGRLLPMPRSDGHQSCRMR